MKKYTVIALSVGANSNRIFSAGDEVNEDAFEPGRAEELVEKGFLQRFEDQQEANLESTGDGLNDNTGDKELNPDTPPEFQDPTNQEVDTTVPPEFQNSQQLGDQFNDAVPSQEKIVSTEENQSAPDNVIDSIPDLDKITKGEIIKSLKEKGVEFDVNSNKQDLYNLLYKKN